ncbi:MAG TPA: methyl-accepting chemotaxis protein [Planctomycetota bacterium]|nr:methyl-accepting chemotaxis protein [Planctomycetota bacterium]
MSRNWTFGQKLAAGFGLIMGIAVVITIIAIYALRGVVEAKDEVITHFAQNMIDAEQLSGAIESKVAASRGFLLTNERRFEDSMQTADSGINENFTALRAHVISDQGKIQLAQVQQAETDLSAVMTKVIERRKADATSDAAIKLFEEEAIPRRDKLKVAIKTFRDYQQKRLDQGQEIADTSANNAINLVIGCAIAGVLLSILLAWTLTRAITRQIVSAITHIQSSSSELQAAANQQATSAKENSTAMSEITTTVNELLATSRQIAESAQRVSQIASETATGARAGENTVQKTQEAVASIKRQVEQIVNHMLDLGKKSQQIGGILEIINELSEQTNILAINATIEAAGAGETGRRFAVVAEEIRKLADRVGNSTKEIRGLIDEIRSSVNTTVMATETGSKAVDAGFHQFGDLAASFKQIVSSVVTTTEASREIELSTKQQATAVEQVNIAVANVAQTTKETEASANQTFQTSSQLTGLAKELSSIVQPTGA